MKTLKTLAGVFVVVLSIGASLILPIAIQPAAAATNTTANSNWQVKASYPAEVLPDVIACPSTTTCFAVGENTSLAGTVVSTTNSGLTWPSETLPSTSNLFGIACLSVTTCFAVGNGTGYVGAVILEGSIAVPPPGNPGCSSNGVGSANFPGGYWLASTAGVVNSRGDAPLYGSMGGKPLNKPIVGIAATSDNEGYWLVALDGAIFAFGAPFHGPTGCMTLNEPIVALVASSNTTIIGSGTACEPAGTPRSPGGYQFVAQDGGVFSFGNAVFAGSLGGQGITDIVGMANS